MRIVILLTFLLTICNISIAQDYWQQRVSYEMDIQFDVKSHQFDGHQILKYYNNSPDTLYKVYYHLYYNAFQPNSMMAMRRAQVEDPDGRFQLMDEINNLNEDEIGYQKVTSLKQDGRSVSFSVSETILIVELDKPILPNSSTVFEMEFNAQVPLQIRRTGRNSFDGVDYSMAQWYPKMAEYDEAGWHTHPYVAREFYAPWGDFDVKITIDKSYVLAGTGILQNPNEIGYGYQTTDKEIKRKGKTLTWNFKAENVHDFVWAADPDYKHTTAQVPNGPLLRFFYIPNEDTKLWDEVLPEYTVKAWQYMNKVFGEYGWSQYSVIQGGDGGMEYPMATLIINKKPSGVRSLKSLVGVVIHEAMHSWYQGMMATNESYFAWMDEGFTSYTENYVKDHIYETNLTHPNQSDIKTYIRWANTGKEEPASIHSDHFVRNRGYSRASYTKGSVALSQLNYIVGEKTLHQGLRNYRNQWGFKHPDDNDFIRVIEKVSDMQLHWFLDLWINSTYTIDYGISDVIEQDNETQILLSKTGRIPMPLDITLTLKSGEKMLYYIPIGLMLGEKANETDLKRETLETWRWTHPGYSFAVPFTKDQIKSIEIDESGRLADVNREDNLYEVGANENQERVDDSEE